MGKRKKPDVESNPPLKMVIGLSPNKKRQEETEYVVLAKQEAKKKMKTKNKTTSAGPKRQPRNPNDGLIVIQDDDDDIEVLGVFKPNQPKTARQKSRVPAGSSLIMDCVEEELSQAQRKAIKDALSQRDSVKKRIDNITKNHGAHCVKVEHVDHYLEPEGTKVLQSETSSRSSSPEVILVDEADKAARPLRPQRNASSNPSPVSAGPRSQPAILPTQNINFQGLVPGTQPLAPGMPAMLGAGVKAQLQGSNLILMGPNEQPLQVMPTQLLSQGSQSIVLHSSPSGHFQVVNPHQSAQPRAIVSPGTSQVKRNASSKGPFSLGGATTVSGTNGLGVKRPISSANNWALNEPTPFVKRARGGSKKQLMTESSLQDTMHSSSSSQDLVNWVPLDEYYYSKKEGDPTYREQKGEYRFKCWYCCKMLYNNLRLMMHIQGHIDSEKQQNLDLSDLTQCKHCYKQFGTPFELQCHVEKIHQKQSNVLVCRICEKDHARPDHLRAHMRYHNICEMPYICQLCNFRSSVYNDVVDHFKKRHDSSRYLLCLYCLKTFETKFVKAGGWGMTQVYHQHMLKHMNKGTNKKCSRCKLAFVSKAGLVLHKNKDHMPNYKGTLGGNASSTLDANSEQVMIQIPDSQALSQMKWKPKSLNAPVTTTFVANVKFYGVTNIHLCVECQKPMRSTDHYRKVTDCSMCRYETVCNESFANHMAGFHSRKTDKRKEKHEKPLLKPMFCLCGFSSAYGNKIANHLVFCSKRTSYAEKPEVRYFEYDDEQEEYNPFEPYSEDTDTIEKQVTSPERDIPSLFGALGLVKKLPSRSSRQCSRESSPFRDLSSESVVGGILDDILDNMFPAEAAAGECISSLLNNVFDEIGKKFQSETQRTKSRRLSSSGVSKASSVSGDTPSRRASNETVTSEDTEALQDWSLAPENHYEMSDGVHKEKFPLLSNIDANIKAAMEPAGLGTEQISFSASDDDDDSEGLEQVQDKLTSTILQLESNLAEQDQSANADNTASIKNLAELDSPKSDQTVSSAEQITAENVEPVAPLKTVSETDVQQEAPTATISDNAEEQNDNCDRGETAMDSSETNQIRSSEEHVATQLETSSDVSAQQETTTATTNENMEEQNDTNCDETAMLSSETHQTLTSEEMETLETVPLPLETPSITNNDNRDEKNDINDDETTMDSSETNVIVASDQMPVAQLETNSGTSDQQETLMTTASDNIEELNNIYPDETPIETQQTATADQMPQSASAADSGSIPETSLQVENLEEQTDSYGGETAMETSETDSSVLPSVDQIPAAQWNTVPDIPCDPGTPVHDENVEGMDENFGSGVREDQSETNENVQMTTSSAETVTEASEQDMPQNNFAEQDMPQNNFADQTVDSERADENCDTNQTESSACLNPASSYQSIEETEAQQQEFSASAGNDSSHENLEGLNEHYSGVVIQGEQSSVTQEEPTPTADDAQATNRQSVTSGPQASPSIDSANNKSYGIPPPETQRNNPGEDKVVTPHPDRHAAEGTSREKKDLTDYRDKDRVSHHQGHHRSDKSEWRDRHRDRQDSYDHHRSHWNDGKYRDHHHSHYNRPYDRDRYGNYGPPGHNDHYGGHHNRHGSRGHSPHGSHRNDHKDHYQRHNRGHGYYGNRGRY